MFNFPIIKNRSNLYQKYNLGPDASDDDILTAKSERDTFLNEKKTLLIEQNKELNNKVIELTEKEKKLIDLEVEKTNKTSDNQMKYNETNDLSREIKKLKDELSTNSNYEKFVNELNEINNQINENNQVEIAKKQDKKDLESKKNEKIQADKIRNREKYDADNPPFSILKIETTDFPMFQDNKTILFLLRKELDSFFKDIFSLNIYHPSDLTKKDFSSDFYYNDKLDT